jgi:hypothetical protein
MFLVPVYQSPRTPAIAVGEDAAGEGVVVSRGPGAVAVPGTSNLESVSCTSAEQCYAVGLATSDLDEGVLVSITRGRPRSVTPLPAFIGLYGIACPAADTCYAVGYDNADDAGSVTTITNGQASAPAEVPDGGYTPWLNAISCPTPTQCYAAGLVNYLPSIVPVTAGTPQAAVTVPDAWYLSGIDCPAAGSCSRSARTAPSRASSPPWPPGRPARPGWWPAPATSTGWAVLPAAAACWLAPARSAPAASAPGSSSLTSAALRSIAGSFRAAAGWARPHADGT